MSECICCNCRNLIGVISDEGGIKEYECQYGYPSEQCSECEEEEGCTCECSHYEADQEEKENETVVCAGCGKLLVKACKDNEQGEIYCMECFLRK